VKCEALIIFFPFFLNKWLQYPPLPDAAADAIWRYDSFRSGMDLFHNR